MNISIIVPVYNVEKYLVQCIESILNQTYTDFELLLIDDGSIDDSVRICNFYANIDPRVKVFYKINGGVSSARNYGLDKCRGEFVCFIDSDDYIENCYLEYLYQLICNSEYDFVSCIANFVDENSCFIKKNKYNISEKEICKKELFETYFNTNLIEDAPWNKMYKKEVFDNLRFKEDVIFEDTEIIVKILKKCNKVLFTDKQLYNYRIRNNSILDYSNSDIEKKKFSLKKLDLLKVYSSCIDELKGTEYEKIYIRNIIRVSVDYYEKATHLSKNDKKTVKSVIKPYIKTYKPYILKKDYFSTKEKLYLILAIIFKEFFFKCINR